MIGMENADNSFFYITTSDLPKGKIGDINKIIDKKNVFSKDVINFSVKEEMGKIKSGNISFMDEENFYVSLMKTGTPFNLVWGYKKNPYSNIQDVFAESQGKVSELASSPNIRKMKCYVISPSGSGDQSGRYIYNCSFYAHNYFDARITTVWNKMSYGNMIRDVMRYQMNISNKDIFMDYGNQDVRINIKNPVRQNDEKPFEFLTRIAKQEKCAFETNYNSNGDEMGLFIDSNKLDSQTAKDYLGKIANKKKGYNEFTYRQANSKVNDVTSFSWRHNVGEDGTGSNVRVVLVGGQATYFFAVAGQKILKGYVFNPGQVDKILKEHGSLDVFFKLLTADFDTLKKQDIFTEKTFETAPEGFGFNITLELSTGNPNITVPMEVFFSEGEKKSKGFPKILCSVGNTWYIQSVTHNIAQRYTQTIEVGDTFAITGGSFVGAVPAFNG